MRLTEARRGLQDVASMERSVRNLGDPRRFLPRGCRRYWHADIEPRKGKPRHGGMPKPKLETSSYSHRGLEKYGMRILRHIRGNPDPGLYRSLSRSSQSKPRGCEKYGMRILRHIRGNPDPGLYRSLSQPHPLNHEPKHMEVGPPSQLVNRTDGLWGVGSGHNTPRAGKPSAWGRA